MSQGNVFAYVMLVIFPIIASVLFRKLPTYSAIAWTICLGYLILPVDTFFDLPALPPFTKDVIPALVAWAFIVVYVKDRLRLVPEHGGIRAIYVLSFLSIAATCLVNGDKLIYGATVLPGHGLFNTSDMSLMVIQLFLLVPFMLGRQFLSSDEGLSCLLKVLVTSGVFYCLLVLWEIRMSPQLHTQIYGYFPHDGGMVQQKRAGGFRSVAFIGHGLRVAVFLATVLVAAIYLYRTKQKVVPLSPLAVVVFVGLVILVSKTFAAFAYSICAVAFFFLLNAKLQRVALFLLCCVVLAYPLIRGNELYPDDYAVSLASELSDDRAHSLAFRFYYEEKLLNKAEEKQLFGWGNYSRNRVYDLDGNDDSVTDGEWLIVFGSKGWLGYLCYYGLLVLPVVIWIKNVKRYGKPPIEVVYLSFIVMVIVANTLINSGISPIIWLISGALLGYSERRSKEHKSKQIMIAE